LKYLNTKLAAALLCAAFCIGIAAFPVLAKAEGSRMYFAGYFGLNIAKKQNFSENTTGRSGDIGGSNSFTFAGALGLRLDSHWRVEAEASYRSMPVNDVSVSGRGGSNSAGGDISTGLYLANIYYDFDTRWRNLTPFVTAGVGIASHSVNFKDSSGFLPSASDSSFGFAYQAGAGLKFRLNKDVSLTGSYRFIGTSSIEADTYDIDYKSQEIRLGIQYDIPPNWFK
jgi:opacity protein-like surface antigen